MLKKLEKVEILSPAGSMEAVQAAVACGADAVYLGGRELNARRNATNFAPEELGEIVALCHSYGVKVYLTLNILVYDGEIAEAIEAINTAVNAGVDAVIVQDMAVVKLIKEMAPTLPIHASTQMVIHNLQGAKLAKEMGISRVVLARELTRDEIGVIAGANIVETEVFIHGALCMSVSGQCYLSSMIGERSGNRGLCAQPCRLPFKVEDSQYSLSLKDLSIVEDIKELEKLGVTSVKIEGRMKRPEYVAAATKSAYEAREGRWVDMEELQQVFSRSGFTKGYFEDNMDSYMFGTRQKEDVVSATAVLGKLAGLYRNTVPRINVKMEITAKLGEKSQLRVIDSDGNEAVSLGDVVEAAINKPTDLEKAEQNLGKTGGTPFILQELTGTIEEGVILPASVLNKLRRDAFDQIIAVRSKGASYELQPYSPVKLAKTTGDKVPSYRIRVMEAEQILPEFLQEAQGVIIPLSLAKTYVKTLDKSQVEKHWVELPAVDFTTEETTKDVKELIELGIEHFVVGNLGSVMICKEQGAKYIHGNSFLNTFNSLSVEMLKEIGLCDTEVSIELNLSAIQRLDKHINLGMVAYGYLPLMTFRNCPIKINKGCGKCSGFEEIIDRKYTEFFVSCKSQKMSKSASLYNAVPLYQGDRLREIKGMDFITLSFTKETPEQVEDIWYSYQDGESYNGDLTRGLYYRNVR